MGNCIAQTFLIRILFLGCAVLRAGWQEYNMRAQVSAVKAAAVVQHSLASFLEIDLTVKNFCIVIAFVGVYLSTWHSFRRISNTYCSIVNNTMCFKAGHLSLKTSCKKVAF